MTLFNAAGTSSQAIVSQVTQTLTAIRSAMDAARDLHAWSSGIADTDLTAAPPDGPGMALADADALLSACADAYALACYYGDGSDTDGLPPGSYPQPPSAYAYGASQRRVIGPRMT